MKIGNIILWILGCNWNISDNVFIGNFISDEILIKDHFWFKDYENVLCTQQRMSVLKSGEA